MPNMVESEIVHDHPPPVFIDKFIRNMASHIVIHFSKVLIQFQLSLFYYDTNA